MTKLLSFILLAAFTLSCAGWGLLSRRLLHLRKGTWPTTVVLGLALLVAVGGVLNLARLVSPLTLAVSFLIGLVLAGPACFRACREPSAALRRIRQSLPMWGFAWPVIALAVTHTVLTQLPPGAYNLDDDFTAYFTHPVRMVQTGTILGSVLSPIGIDTLGGQAFLQSFVVGFFPIVYVNAADAVFGLLLCLLLVVQLAGTRSNNLLPALLGLAGVVLIDPQHVNVSTLYLWSALVLGLVTLSTDPRELTSEGLPSSAAMGLLYGSLASLKATLAVFALLHLALASGATACSTRSARRGVRWAISAGLATILTLASWLILHAPNYLAMLSSSTGDVFVPEGPVYEARLFNAARDMYGIASVRDYTILMIAVGLSGVLAILLARKNCLQRGFIAWMILAHSVGAIVFYLMMVFSYAQTVIRYSLPVVIAVAPATLVCAWRAIPRDARWRNKLAKLSLVAYAAGALAMFLPSGLHRYETSVTVGNTLGFPTAASEGYRSAYENALKESAKVHHLQSLTPPGAPILAWIGTPFLLDYKRNPIVDFKHVALKTFGGRIPRVRYVIVQYRGMLESLDQIANDSIKLNRMTRMREHAFAYELNRMISDGEVLFDDGLIKVVRVRG